MIKQLFLVFKVTAGVEPDANVMSDKIEKVLELAGNDNFIETECCDVERGFYYCLCDFDEPLESARVENIKSLLLQGKLECDVLMSDNFPCFSERCTQPGALVMDMDMTTVQIEGIDEIARRLGVFDEVAAITHEAMHGKLDFSQSLRKRVSLLKGGDAASILSDVRSNMPETAGLDALMACCDEIRAIPGMSKFATCIASGGFHNLISAIDEKYHLTAVRANRLEVDEQGKFTGLVDGPIIDGQAKADLVKELKASGIPQDRIIVLGDGANDLMMMQEGGLGIAYHAKPKVQEQQLNALNVGDLSAVAYLLYLRSALESDVISDQDD